MKKTFIKTVLFSIAIGVSCLASNVYAFDEAANCTFTGNSSDYCNASDGTHNLRIINCRPGHTDCNYDTIHVPTHQ